MNSNWRALLIPIDNRPVTYLYPQLVAAVAGIEVIVPPRELMGSLTQPADVAAIGKWLQETVNQETPDVLFVCLDTLLYGGLVSSRRGQESHEEIASRLKILFDLKESEQPEVFVQSAIMRIPNYDDNTEEPLYWNKYGRLLYRWSEQLHQLLMGKVSDESELAQIESELIPEVTSDFLWRRKRNHEVQRELLAFVLNKRIDFLIFSQDDSGQYGLNVFEKEQILSEAQALGLSNVIAYPGADEVILTMITRWLISRQERVPKLCVQYSPDNGAQGASNFEGQTIGESLHKQCQAFGVEVSPEAQDTDLIVIVHTAGQDQGDHMWLPGHTDKRKLDTSKSVQQTIALLEQANAPCILCDVAYSNGSDPDLIQQLLVRPELMEKLYSYAAWNTTGNTVGSALALGINRWIAQNNKQYDAAAWKRAMFIRLADDWAYQTQVRPQLSSPPLVHQAEELVGPYLEKIAVAMQLPLPMVNVQFPWQRTFEVEYIFPRSGN